MSLAACEFKDQLLEPQNPGIIDPSAVSSPTAATALRVGALGQFKGTTGASESMWRWGGMLGDEFKTSDTFSQRNETDQRQVQTNNGTWSPIYAAAQQTRGYLRDAIEKMTQFNGDQTTNISELYMSLAFLEMQMAEDLCNGIPMGLARNGVVDYSDPAYKPKTNAEVYAIASGHADTALSMSVGTDAASVLIHNAALVTKARILVDLGQQPAAGALVPTAAVPTSFQYLESFSQTTTDNGLWTFNNSQGRYTVGDSTDTANGVANVVKNALPFVSANDPRVPVKAGTSFSPAIKPFDQSTPLWVQQIWSNRGDDVPLVSGLDARLIEAETKLAGDDIAGMMTILNSLRATPPTMGAFKPAAMAALATPATKDAAVSLYFREKAFWTFGRGQRLGDLRRLIRQYNRTQDNVFPSGVFFKGGAQYGQDVNLPVTDTEKTNPNFTGCIDRKA
ncbi:MAG TPA: hypothetical protein VGM82_05460 [Gemmatimonadaceae bacterium]|jgi:hypothetical protein